MTGKDYRKEWNSIQQSTISLKAHVEERLKELVRKYPDAKIDFNTKAKEFSHIGLECLSTFGMIVYIEKIEKWSADQQPVIQTKIKL
jgi:hypothetical protein